MHAAERVHEVHTPDGAAMSGDTSSRLKTDPTALRVFVWLAAAFAALCAWGWIAAQAPPRFRVLIVWGLVAGALLALLTRALKLPNRRLMGLLTFFATGLGAVAYTWACSQQGLEPLRERIAEFDRRIQSDPANGIIRQFEQGRDAAPDPETLAKSGLTRAEYDRQRDAFVAEIRRGREAREARRRELERDLTFSGYLDRRIASWGRWPAPWPVVFWGCELFVASALAGAIVSWTASRRFCTACDEWEYSGAPVIYGSVEAVPVLGLLELSHPPLQSTTRLVLEPFGCRCADVPPRLRCRLDEANGRTVELGERQPTPQVWQAVQSLEQKAAIGS
ncbi:MAG TPA: hypothetical protein VHB77_21635 [Planctomycetaceae bacterium]|nr:hypothetical protein [Planctomycetaceae bacterium]